MHRNLQHWPWKHVQFSQLSHGTKCKHCGHERISNHQNQYGGEQALCLGHLQKRL
jgi:hypothetical protein